jgi:hypothetical protein
MKRFFGEQSGLLRLVIAAVPVVVAGYLVIRYFSFSGTYTIEYNFQNDSKIVSEFTPGGRALDREKNLETGEAYQRIIGEPVYMDVEVPRSFDSVTVDVDYENPDQPFVELGLVTTQKPWAVALQPFENRVIDAAQKEWTRTQGADGLVLLQRTATAASVEDFLQNPPADQQIGIYHYAFSPVYHEEGYTSASTSLVVNTQLRGAHSFLTYIKDETLHAQFTLADINTQSSSDDVTLRVYNADNDLQVEQSLADDGVTDASRTVSQPRTVTVDLPGLPEGVYRIDVVATDDTVIQRMETTQRYFVAKNHISVLNNSSYDNVLPGTDTAAQQILFAGNKFIAHTNDSAGVQAVQIDGDALAIDQIATPYTWVRTNTAATGTHRISAPQNDVILDGKGVFGFTQDSFFNPNGNIVQMDDATVLDELDAILYKGYTSPDDSDTIKTQTLDMSLNGVQGDRKELKFVLSAPGIDRNHRTITMHRMQFTFYRTPFLTRVWDRLFH